MQVVELNGAKLGDEVIGFAGVMYTLWKVDVLGYNKIVYYVKSISKSLDEARRAYPNAHFCPTLHGLGRYTISEGTKPTEDDEAPLTDRKPDTFRMPFGKYEGKHLEEIDDLNYLAWLSRDSYNAKVKLMARVYLLERKAEQVEVVEDDVYTKAELAKKAAEREKEFAKSEKIRRAIANGSEVELELVTNGKELRLGCDYHVALDSDGNEIAFESAQGFIYNGYTYYLPCDGKGKSHRVKGKTIIAKVTTGNRGEFLVTDYRIKK